MLETQPDVDVIGEEGSALILGRREIGQSKRVRGGTQGTKSNNCLAMGVGVGSLSNFKNQPVHPFRGTDFPHINQRPYTHCPEESRQDRRGILGERWATGVIPAHPTSSRNRMRTMAEDHRRKACMGGAFRYLTVEPQGTNPYMIHRMNTDLL